MRTGKSIKSVLSALAFIAGCSNPISDVESDKPTVIVPTEIMYNNGVDSLEFIELKNVSPSKVALKGMFFSEGIQYQFSDGEYIGGGQYFVLTNSRELFCKRYPDIVIGGVFSGRLDNGGEKIVLIGGVKSVFEIEYQSNGFWPSLADGLGYSLVTVDENDPGDQNDFNDWRASSNKNGSPGKEDALEKLNAVYVNEIVTSGLTERIDQIELYNPSKTSSVDISNWFLTDDRKNPKKFKIPSGTTIQPDGFVVFTADQFKNFMSISTGGGSVYLFSANADSSYTGFSQGIDFESSSIGASFGLICNSEGRYFTCHLKEPTIGQVNSQPVAGSVAISEIMYNPLPGGVEFLEIVNTTNDSVNLFSNDLFWKISGISFDFTTQITLKKGALLLLINNSTPVTTFRTLNHIDTSVVILQYTGKLSNDGENITIEKPGSAWVDTLGVIEYSTVTVDAVSYKDSSPWPKSADGDGYSLVRKDLNSWGNEPQNWKRSDATGGSPGEL
jgi:hypothetical protein